MLPQSSTAANASRRPSRDTSWPLWQHPPYLHDGSARDLLAVVDHYDRLFGLKLTGSQRADLIEY